jgi:integrase
MSKEGYRTATIQHSVRTLRAVARKCNLLNPETVKVYLAKADISETRKVKICEDLDRFYRHKGIRFEKPRYRKIETLPFIPLEVEVSQLISGVGRKTACFLQLLKETGMRTGEAYDLKWTDLDLEKGTVIVLPEKHSHARQLKISPPLIAMLNQLERKWPLVFRNPSISKESSLHVFRRHYVHQRKRLADKLQNPRLNSITFKTLRHFYATLLYSRTRDLLLVKENLGHRAIQNTLVYTHLVKFDSDEYTCKTAKTIAEAQSLIETGFDYVTDYQDSKLFRKRK